MSYEQRLNNSRKEADEHNEETNDEQGTKEIEAHEAKVPEGVTISFLDNHLILRFQDNVEGIQEEDVNDGSFKPFFQKILVLL